MAELRCPTCHQLFDAETSEAVPFCSNRCRQIDLGRWLEERMTLPVDPEQALEQGEADEAER